jgi:hypothetical protein
VLEDAPDLDRNVAYDMDLADETFMAIRSNLNGSQHIQRQPGAQRLEISGRDLVHENENVERVNEELRVHPMLVGVERGGFRPRC